jgi:hypothetical protein
MGSGRRNRLGCSNRNRKPPIETAHCLSRGMCLTLKRIDKFKVSPGNFADRCVTCDLVGFPIDESLYGPRRSR